MKYTDEQIKKALEKCLFKSVFGECEDCAFDGEKPCIPTLVKNVFDLINYQEAEIERSKEKNRLANQCTPKAIRRARAEAIKEFWNELKKRNTLDYRIVSTITGDNLVKEMVGESNGK